jgi:hypothetical protein
MKLLEPDIYSCEILIGAYQYRSWWQRKPTKVMNLRDARLSRAEILCLVSGILLLMFAACRETVMAMSL